MTFSRMSLNKELFAIDIGIKRQLRAKVNIVLYRTFVLYLDKSH